MKSLSFAVLGVVLSVSTAEAGGWVRADDDGGAAIVEARCNLMAMNADQGYFAWGRPGYVLGAALGNAIGNAIRRSEVKRNCMAMSGYRWASTRRAMKQSANVRQNLQRKRAKLSRACQAARTMAGLVAHCGK